jgi:hypothetical protein
MASWKVRLALMFSTVLLGACAAERVALGEPCEAPGETTECVDGGVCTNLSGSDAETTGDENQCLALCDDDDDCADDEGCRGISNGNLKSCQADDLDG